MPGLFSGAFAVSYFQGGHVCVLQGKTHQPPRSRTLDPPWNAHGLDLFWDRSSSSSIRSENIEGLSLKQRCRGGVYWEVWWKDVKSHTSNLYMIR